MKVLASLQNLSVHVSFSTFFSADAIVVSRYNETRHLRTQAALSKLASNVAQKLEAM
jgi:hypothetical protein